MEQQNGFDGLNITDHFANDGSDSNVSFIDESESSVESDNEDVDSVTSQQVLTETEKKDRKREKDSKYHSKKVQCKVCKKFVSRGYLRGA